MQITFSIFSGPPNKFRSISFQSRHWRMMFRRLKCLAPDSGRVSTFRNSQSWPRHVTTPPNPSDGHSIGVRSMYFLLANHIGVQSCKSLIAKQPIQMSYSGYILPYWLHRYAEQLRKYFSQWMSFWLKVNLDTEGGNIAHPDSLYCDLLQCKAKDF